MYRSKSGYDQPQKIGEELNMPLDHWALPWQKAHKQYGPHYFER